MSDRIDFYLGQLVTELDLDTVQANLDQSIRRIMADQIYAGIVSGYEVVEHNPIPNLTVDVAGPGIAYDQTGRRVYLPAPVTVNCATDSSGSSTAVANPGNERWVSLFAQYDEVASNLEIDDNGVPVLRDVAESYRIRVVQGAEAAIGAATRPALLSDGLLIADVRLENGTTQIFDADIESGDSSITTTRFHWTFRLNASAPATVFEGTLPDVLQATLTELNTHITDLGNAHPATAVEYDVTAVPARFDTLEVATNLQEAIDGLVTDVQLEISRVALDGYDSGPDYATPGRSGVVIGYNATATGASTNVTITAGVAIKRIDTEHARTLRMTSSSVVSLGASQDAANPRWVAIELNTTTGAIVTTLGTAGAAASIVFPSGVANRIPLCYVWLPATGNNVAQTDIVDCRPILSSLRHMSDALVPALPSFGAVGGVSASTTSVATLESVYGAWSDGLPFRLVGHTVDFTANAGYWSAGESFAALAGDDGWVKVFIVKPPYPVGYDSDVSRTPRTFYHTGTRLRGAMQGQVRGGIVIVTEGVNPTYGPAGIPAAAIGSNDAAWNGATSTEGVYIGSLSYDNGVGWYLTSIVGDTTFFDPSTYPNRRSVVGDGNAGTTSFRSNDPLNGGAAGHFPSHRCQYLVGASLNSAAANPSSAYLRSTGGTPEYFFRINRPAGNEVTEVVDQFWVESTQTLDWNIPASAGAHTLVVWVKGYKDGILSMR
ncbi:MAG: hypothetical protein E6R03_13360 [Hyphomicrobiaceae bacterium]|nr:MAG: hypothetical protein E6R03_13360 [Hyphomicrobiaceae bacterium]